MAKSRWLRIQSGTHVFPLTLTLDLRVVIPHDGRITVASGVGPAVTLLTMLRMGFRHDTPPLKKGTRLQIVVCKREHNAYQSHIWNSPERKWREPEGRAGTAASRQR